MFQQLINNYFRPNKSKITDVLFDIELFFNYMQQYQQYDDVWYFQNVFSSSYWNYLGRYSWLSTEQQNYLNQGILCIILFRCYQHIEGSNRFRDNEILEIKSSILKYNIEDIPSIEMKNIVITAIRSLENMDTSICDCEVIKSISRTLRSTVVMNSIKEINQK